jgi:hypothetical protein
MSSYKDVKGALSGGSSVITLSKGTRKGSKTGGSQDEGGLATAAVEVTGEVAAGVPAEASESAERADSAEAAAAADPEAVAAARQELQLDGEKDDTLDDGDGDAADGAAAQVRQQENLEEGW